MKVVKANQSYVNDTPTIKPRRNRSTKENHSPQREPSNDPNKSVNLSIMSEKIPKAITPIGVNFFPLRPKNLENETKISLYSEVERLSILNYEIKTQNDFLMKQVSMHKPLKQRLSEIEAINHGLNCELARRDQAIGLKNEEIEALRTQLTGLMNSDMMNKDLLLKNQALQNELDRLNNSLRSRNHDLEIIKHDLVKLQGAPFKINDLNKKINGLSSEIHEKNKEIEDLKEKNKNLISQIHIITSDNEAWKNKCDEIKHANEQEKNELKIQYEITKNVQTEKEIKDVSNRFMQEKANLEGKLKSTENKLTLLAPEVQKLRDVLKEKDIQLVDLGDKVKNLETQLHDFDTVKKLLSDTTKEIENLREQLNHQERRHVGNLEEHKKMAVASLDNQKKEIENNLKIVFDYQLKDAQAKWNQEKSDLEALIHKQTVDNENLSRANQNYSAELNKLQKQLILQEGMAKAQLDELKQQLDNQKMKEIQSIMLDNQKQIENQIALYRQRNTDLETKLRNLAEENSRIAHMNDERLKEVAELNNQLKLMDHDHKTHIDEIQKKNAISSRVSMEKEIKELNNKHSTELNTLETKIFQQDQTISNLENKVAFLNEENERLKSLCNYKQTELDDQKKKYQNLELTRTRDLESLRQQFEAYKKANIDINTLHVKFEAERTTYQTQIIQLKEKLNQSEVKVNMMQNEIEKLDCMYRDKLDEIDNLKKRHKEYEELATHEKGELLAQIENLRKGSLDDKELSIRYSGEKASYENQVRQLKIMNENGKQELEKLYELMNQRKKEFDNYLKQNEELRKQVEKLTKQVNIVDNEYSSKSAKYEHMLKVIQDLERDKKMLQDQLDRQSNEIGKKNNELSDKINEIEGLKTKYENAIENYNKLSQQLMNKLMHA